MSKSDLALLVGIPIALTRRPWALQVSWRAGGSVGEVRRWGGASRDAASECKRPLTLRQLSTVSQIQQAPSISNYIYSKLKVKQQRRNVSQFALHTLIWVYIKLLTQSGNTYPKNVHFQARPKNTLQDGFCTTFVHLETERKKVWSRLSAHFQTFFQAHSVYFNISRRKIPYFDALRQKTPFLKFLHQNRVVFDCCATKLF